MVLTKNCCDKCPKSETCQIACEKYNEEHSQEKPWEFFKGYKPAWMNKYFKTK